MLKRKIIIFATACLLFSVNILAFAENKTIILGGKSGWPKLSVERGVTTGAGRFGYTAYELSTNARKVTEYTDLLIDFDGKTPVDKTDNYVIKENNLLPTPKAVMGRGAAVCTGHSKGLVLEGKDGSLFGTEGLTGSFTIEFWLSPSIAENGEVVLSWRSSKNNSDKVIYQTISASFFNNRLEWKFTNVFSGYKNNDGEVSLTSYKSVVPDKWAHHVVSFDDSTGLLEYRIDGKIEALQYLTTSGHEQSGSVYTPELGVVADLEICPSYIGSIDDFRIIRTNIEGKGAAVAPLPAYPKQESMSSIHYDTYRRQGGRIETQPLLVNAGSILNSIEAEMNEPEETSIQFFVRGGNNYFSWTDDEPAWIPIELGEKITGITGRYFQVAANIYPDGNGKKTPSITELRVNYKETPLPLPPFKVFATPSDGTVTLSWSHSLEEGVGGYYVYYGERPGEYLGDISKNGKSPIDVGNISTYTISGLSNGTVYYFAIATYSSVDNSIVGNLSQEVSARPLPQRKK